MEIIGGVIQKSHNDSTDLNEGDYQHLTADEKSASDAAVAASHTAGTDPGLDAGGPNAVTAAQLKTLKDTTVPGKLDKLKTIFTGATELTIASDAITVTQSVHLVDTESDAASDNLATINGGADGQLLLIRAAHTDRTVVIKHGTGNILTAGTDVSLDDTSKYTILIYDGALSKWVIAGGAGASALEHTQGTDTESVISTGLADGTYSGAYEVGTLGATIAFGELCYYDFTTSKWLKAKFDAIATCSGKLGFCILAGDDTDATKMLRSGTIRADAIFPALTAGPVYGSAATAGAIVSAAPSGTTDFVVRVVGSANDANEINVNISPDYITLA